MNLIDDSRVAPLGGASSSVNGGGMSASDLAAQMSDAAHQSIQFQAMTLDLQRAHNTFNTILSAKQEGIKSVGDCVKDSIRKGSYQ